MKKYILIPFVVNCYILNAQEHQIVVKQLQDISTFYNSTSDLNQAFVYPNAINVSIPAAATATKLYCQVVFANQSNEIVAQQLFLKRSSHSMPGIALSTLPKLLLEIPASSNATELLFDLSILAQTRWIQPGNYTYSLKFTTTTP